MERVCFIAPYKELAILGQQANKMLGTNVQIRIGDLEKGVLSTKEAIKQGAQVVVSRGGTATIIKKKVDIPVVEVKVSGYDILKVLCKFSSIEGPIGVVGYQNVVNGCRTISDILKIPIKEFILSNTGIIDWSHVHEQIDKMIEKEGIRTIIGDTVIISKLDLKGIETQLITSGIEAVVQAFEDAVQILHATEQEVEKRKQFQAVLDFVHDGVIVTDKKGTISFLNPTAEETFKVKKEEVIGKRIGQVMHDSGFNKVLETGMAEIQQLQEIDDGHIMINRIPVIVSGQIKGLVATFQEITRIQDAEQKIRQNLYSKGLVTKYKFVDILTCDQKMKRLIDVAKGYSRTDATVLIEGESGTGKEVLAQSIHAESPRKQGPFVAVNCAALPPQLLESELFGYEEGAFTGAKKGGKLGLFELAQDGTVFLDEIGEMDKNLQSRLLRVLEEKQIMRIGSDRIIPVNTRIIAATNANLKQNVSQGRFRADLFYRLNVLYIKTIPLRERKADIKYLSHYFIRKCNEQYGFQVEKLSTDVVDFLTNYTWPGNVRELRNVIERMVLSASNDYITMDSIKFIVEDVCHAPEAEVKMDSPGQFLSGTMQDIKGKIIREVLKSEEYNKSRTARRLGIDRSTIERYL